MTTIKLNDLIITIDGPRPDGSYAAWFGDYGLDCMEGWGRTKLSAASDLLDKHCDRMQDRLVRELRNIVC